MTSYKKPTTSQIDKAITLLASPQHCRVFFGKLENPEWVGPLRDKGCFASPPEPVQVKGGVVHPAWPPSEYLVRMAAAAPEEVFKSFEKVQTTNARVISDTAEAALSLPGSLAAELSKKVRQAIQSNVWVQVYADHAADLIVRLAEAGEIASAKSLAERLFALRPKKSFTYDPVGLIPAHDYAELLPRVTLALGKADPECGLKWACNLLRKAASFHQSPEIRRDFHDLSYSWRPAIEDHPQNLKHDVADSVATAVRDLSEFVLREKLWSLGQTVEFLEGFGKLVLSRIGLHVLRLFAEQEPDFARTRMICREYFEGFQYRHEYALLLRDRFIMLQPSEQATILGWIEEGPNREQARGLLKGNLGDDFREEQVERYVRVWQRDHLSWFSDSLPPEWRDRYAGLVAELGVPEHADMPFWVGAGRWGADPPKKADELAAMDAPTLIDFLSTWRPDPQQFMGSSIRDLALVFEAVVRGHLERFASEAPAFAGVHPSYVSSLLREIATALQNGRELPVEPVLDLCLAVVAKPLELAPQDRVGGDSLDSDPSWEYPRGEVARVVEVSCDHGAPLSLRRKLWDCLAPLESSPDYSYLADEPAGDVRIVTWLDHACNNPLSNVLHAVIRYAVWVKSETIRASGGVESAFTGIGEVQEAADLLERHLKAESQDSPAVRSEYGQSFPALCWLDAEWAAALADRIFTLEGDHEKRGWAAWNSYLVSNPVYDRVFGMMRKVYHTAISRLEPSLTPEGDRFNALHKLAEHMVILYGKGILPLDDADGLLQGFLRNSSAVIRSHVIETVGRSLTGAGQIPDGVTGRFVALWEFYWDSFYKKQEDTVPVQFVNFGWWLVCRKLDDQWCLDRVAEIVEIAPLVEPRREVMQRLAELSTAFPAQVMHCADRMVRGDTDGWRIHSWRRDLKALLTNALDSGDEGTRKGAARLIDHLGRRGHQDFGELLSSKHIT